MSEHHTERFVPFVSAMADVARGIALRYFRQSIPIDEKDDRSPVTMADKEIERELRSMIEDAYPDHGVIGEEYGAYNAGASHLWVIDPIDGTRAFMTGKPLFGSIIGLLVDDVPVLGVIDQGFTQERWMGIAGQWATHNGIGIHVSAARSLASARVYTGAPNMFDDADLQGFLRLSRTAKWPQYGCDCYAYGLLAMGWADAVIEKRLQLYDVAGIVPIVTGAGGVMRDWNGLAITREFDGRVVAASDDALARACVDCVMTNDDVLV